jgi:galactan 5-O-arabinofuranosyltransferase
VPSTSAPAPTTGTGTRPPVATGPADRRPLTGQLLRAGAAATACWALLWLVARTLSIGVTGAGSRMPLLVACGVGAALLAVATTLLSVRRPLDVPPLVVGLAAGIVAGLATVALHGTRWNYNALYSDAGFRTEAATRFADSPALADYGYRGLPSYYPPALPWVEGRLAAMLDVPAWATMKPVTLVLAVAVPLLAYLFWRRVLPDGPAALVAVAAAGATVDLVKPDEWLVLAVVLPWWLELVRDVRAPGIRRLPAWAHGIVLGLLLLCHSYYFLPLALATLVGMVVDAVLRRPMPLRPVRAVVVAVVGLVCATPYWAGMAVMRLRGSPADSLQVRWSPAGFQQPPWPLPVDVVGVIGLLCVGWLVLRVRTSALALSIGIALVTTYAFFLGGQWLQRWDVAVLPEKSDELILALLVAGGVLALLDLVLLVDARAGRSASRVLTAVLAVAVAVPLVVGHAEHWLVGRRVLAAQQMRYPDGSWPSGGRPDPTTTRHPWSVSTTGTDPSVDQVRAGWERLTGRALGSGTVLVTSRADLLATTPVHPFTSWKNIYSHPNGQYERRLALLQEVARCTTPGCAWRLLRDNPFDRVDGLVLTRTEAGLRLAVTDDAFPEGWRLVPVVFADSLFRGPLFERRDVGTVAVVALARR